MSKHMALAFVALTMISACGRTPSVDQARPDTAAEDQSAQSRSSETVTTSKAEAARLMGDYVPQFEHRVRSQRHVAEGDGKFFHVVIVEFIGKDAAAVSEELKQELASRGLTVKGPINREGGVVRYIAQNSKVGTMHADINGASTLKLGPGSQGTIYFSWRDAVAR